MKHLERLMLDPRVAACVAARLKVEQVRTLAPHAYHRRRPPHGTVKVCKLDHDLTLVFLPPLPPEAREATAKARDLNPGYRL